MLKFLEAFGTDEVEGRAVGVPEAVGIDLEHTRLWRQDGIDAVLDEIIARIPCGDVHDTAVPSKDAFLRVRHLHQNSLILKRHGTGVPAERVVDAQ